MDGRPRRQCPVCQRFVHVEEPIVAQLVEPVEAKVVTFGDEPVVASVVSSPTIITAQVVSQDSIGIWRDGNEVVVDRAAHQFPMRCVQTNEPVSVLDAVTLKYLHNRRRWSLLGSLGRTIGSTMDREIVPLKFGRSAASKQRDVLMKTLGWVLLIIGWPGLGVLRAISRAKSYPSNEAILTILGAMFFLSAVTGLIVLVACYRKTVHVSSVDDRYVRLKGVGHPLMMSLPEWPNSAVHPTWFR